MRFPLFLSLALVSQTEAFQTTTPLTAIQTRAAVATCLRTELNNEPQRVEKKELLVPKKLTTFQLSALTQLKKDERNRFNKNCLLKMGITMTAFLTAFKRAPAARAATPLVVQGGAIRPLIAQPGLGIVEMPGMRGISPYQIGSLPNQGAMFFALALFVTTALLRAAGKGYVPFVHFVAKHLTNAVKEDTDSRSGDIDLGLPRETDWSSYSHSKLDPLQEKTTKEGSRYSFDPRTFLFERIKTKAEREQAEHEAEDAKLLEANRFFREQKYKQHHHPVHARHSKYEETAYLDTLPINEEERHEMPKGYLDTLSNAKASTWDVYKHQLDEAKPASEVDELKQEVTTLHNLMQIEQSMYQTSNQALKLAMEVQNDEWKRSSTNEDLKDFDEKLSTNEELKAFDEKAREFEDTVVKDAARMSKTEESQSI